MKFAICDDYHIHERNFRSLFTYLQKNDAKFPTLISKGSEEGALIHANGIYKPELSALIMRRALFERFKEEEFINYKYREFDIAEIALGEALSACLPSPAWQKRQIENKRESIISMMLRTNRDILIGCFAAATFWIDYWMERRAKIFGFDAIFVFSGSYIYSKSLLKILRCSNVRAFVLESFTTGDDFYCEERYGPIANASNIQFPNIRRAAATGRLPDGMFDLGWEKEKIRSFNKLLTMKNKNVQQPSRDPLPRSMRDGRIALILGQVANDYSLIDGGARYVNSVPTYRALINFLLDETDMHVIFKCHPWERNKVNIGRAFTRDLIQAHVARLPEDKAARVLVVEHKNLNMLFEQSHAVFTLCSQSAIEAAFQGFKPITLGNPFYRGAGFTSDFSSPRSAVEALARGEIDPLLTLDEFSDFSEFMAILLRRHLLNVTESGDARYNALFEEFKPIPHQRTQRREVEITSTWE